MRIAARVLTAKLRFGRLRLYGNGAKIHMDFSRHFIVSDIGPLIAFDYTHLLSLQNIIIMPYLRRHVAYALK